MRAIETTVTVAADGTAILQLPADIAPGQHQVVVVINQQTNSSTASVQSSQSLSEFPVIHVGAWTETGTFRRQDLYGDDGR